MIGRKAVVICNTTRIKITTHVLKPALDRACEYEKPDFRKRSPKMVATPQNNRCRVPIQAADSVDWENSQATGAKPMSKSVINVSKPATSPKTSTSRVCAPLRQAKM